MNWANCQVMLDFAKCKILLSLAQIPIQVEVGSVSIYVAYIEIITKLCLILPNAYDKEMTFV